MTYPVYVGDRAAGTMTVTAAGQDTVFELRCPDPEPGLWRAWVQGEESRLDLGLLEGGRLRRRFSRRMTAPLGGVRWAYTYPDGETYCYDTGSLGWDRVVDSLPSAG